ncbi:MAG TPA: transcriptional regulator, partial [Actinomycetes bacterium]|nr:transcriptional regulator [Actinomycetes bacterium]
GGAGPAGRRTPTSPRPATRLVRRDAEVAALHRLLAHERLVTVVGPGGVGKTRVAMEVARRVQPATVLPLAPLTDPAAIPHALAAALGLQVVHGDVLSACVALLAAGPHLLVLDSCEHLLEAVRDAVSIALDACPDLTVLATSREPLRPPGERPFRLAPLPLPDPRDTGDPRRAPAVVVFLDRAQRVRPGVASDLHEVRMVGEIVRRLDGMPLAIELAAGQLSSLGLADLHARLDRALDLLGDGRTTSDARHRTLRATIEWSYELLPAHEQRLFRHLSVFPDGFDLATAEALATDLGAAGDPASALAHLVDASMVDAELGGHPRYRMLETLRSFGLDRLLAANEDAPASERMLRWAVDLAAWIDVTATSAHEPAVDARLRRELPNLRAAWRLARHRGRLDDAVALVVALGDAAGWRDLTEVWGWAQELVADPATQAHHRAGAVLGVAASAAWMRGDPAEAGRLARRGLEVATDEEGRWWCLAALALVDLSGGAYSDAVAHAGEAAALAPRADQNYGIAALAAAYGGDLEAASTLNDRLAAMATSPTLLGFHHYVAGEIDSAAGRREQAEERYARAIELARSSGATFGAGIASVGLMTVRADAGCIGQALHGYRDLIDYWERTGGWIQQWTTLRNLAQLLYKLGDHEAALFLQVAADHAPDAATVSETARDQRSPGAHHPVAADQVTRIRAEASSCARARVLDVARQSIDHHLGR